MQLAVAVWVDGFEAAKTPVAWQEGHTLRILDKCAVIRAVSADGVFRMNLTSNAVVPQLLERLQRFHRHGFTVVEVPDFWVHASSRPQFWRDQLTNLALDRTDKLPEPPPLGSRAPYDEGLAREVLTVLNMSYPDPVTMIDIKQALAIEPSDSVLMTALDAMSHEKKIDNVPQFGRAHKLSATLEARLTPLGRDHVKGTSHKIPQVSVTNGDVNINMGGNTGAMGRQSVGTINYQSQWQTFENDVDLNALAGEFGRAVEQQRQTASSASDYQTLSLLAEAKEHAEKRDGSKLMETIANIGQSAVPILVKAGAEGLVHWLEHKTGVKLS